MDGILVTVAILAIASYITELIGKLVTREDAEWEKTEKERVSREWEDRRWS